MKTKALRLGCLNNKWAASLHEKKAGNFFSNLHVSKMSHYGMEHGSVNIANGQAWFLGSVSNIYVSSLFCPSSFLFGGGWALLSHSSADRKEEGTGRLVTLVTGIPNYAAGTMTVYCGKTLIFLLVPLINYYCNKLKFFIFSGYAKHSYDI